MHYIIKLIILIVAGAGVISKNPFVLKDNCNEKSIESYDCISKCISTPHSIHFNDHSSKASYLTDCLKECNLPEFQKKCSYII